MDDSFVVEFISLAILVFWTFVMVKMLLYIRRSERFMRDVGQWVEFQKQQRYAEIQQKQQEQQRQ